MADIPKQLTYSEHMAAIDAIQAELGAHEGRTAEWMETMMDKCWGVWADLMLSSPTGISLRNEFAGVMIRFYCAGIATERNGWPALRG